MPLAAPGIDGARWSPGVDTAETGESAPVVADSSGRVARKKPLEGRLNDEQLACSAAMVRQQGKPLIRTGPRYGWQAPWRQHHSTP